MVYLNNPKLLLSLILKDVLDEFPPKNFIEEAAIAQFKLRAFNLPEQRVNDLLERVKKLLGQ